MEIEVVEVAEEEGDEEGMITLLIRGAVVVVAVVVVVADVEMAAVYGIEDPIKDLPSIWDRYVENRLG
jgi:hypothetical protein